MRRDTRLPPYHCDQHPARYDRTCEPCCEARRIRDRKRARLVGYGLGPSLIDSIGAQRRLSALAANGWPASWLAEMLGLTQQGISDLGVTQLYTTRHTDQQVRDLYDQLWNVHPVGRNAGERMAISRAKARARMFGHEPPLAWDDADLDAPFTIQLDQEAA